MSSLPPWAWQDGAAASPAPTAAAAVGVSTPRSGRRMIRPASAEPGTGNREMGAFPNGTRKHVTDLNREPKILRRKSIQPGNDTLGAAAPKNESIASSAALSNASQTSPGRKRFVRASSASTHLTGARVTSERPQSDEAGGAAPRAKKPVAQEWAKGNGNFLAAMYTTPTTNNSGRAASAEPTSEQRRPSSARKNPLPESKETYDISTTLKTKKRIPPPADKDNTGASNRPVFQRTDEKFESPAYKPKIARRSRDHLGPAAAKRDGVDLSKQPGFIPMPKSNDKLQINKEVNASAKKSHPEKRVFEKKDNAILGSKAEARAAEEAATPRPASGKKRVEQANVGANGESKTPGTIAPRGLKKVEAPQEKASVRGLKTVATAPKTTLCGSQSRGPSPA